MCTHRKGVGLLATDEGEATWMDPAEDHPLAGFFLWEMGSGGQIEGDGSEAGDVLCCPDLLTNCLQTKPTTKKDLQPKAVSP